MSWPGLGSPGDDGVGRSAPVEVLENQADPPPVVSVDANNQVFRTQYERAGRWLSHYERSFS
jgi:hypothetical protein